MELILQRRIDTGEETLGALMFTDKEVICYTLEDTYRPVKVKHQTRIPAGKYQLTFRQFGSHYKKYKDKFSDLKHERGMIQLENVSGFTDILLHIGNNKNDTSGCILVGNDYREIDGGIVLIESTKAYRRVYEAIAEQLEAGRLVTLTIIDEQINETEIDNLIKDVEL